MRSRLFDAIRGELSSRYVPDDVFVIEEVPRTLNGKEMEVPMKKISVGPRGRGGGRRDMALRLVLAVAVAALGVVIAPPAIADTGCGPGGPPPGAASKDVSDIYGHPATPSSRC